MLIEVIAFFCAAFVLYVLVRIALLQWGGEHLDHKLAPDLELPSVSVVIPARNEEDNIINALSGLAAQNYPRDRLEVIVVNDASTDKTRKLVKGFAKDHPQVRLVDGKGLPPGWAGKPHACWQGVQRASGDYLCFMDADTHARPNLLAAAVSYAKQHEIDLLSAIPFQELHSPVEKAFMPGIYMGIATALSFRRINDPKCPDACADGQFLLFRREAYLASGGHEAVKNELMEDVAFAHHFKRSGLRYYWLFADKLVSTRMYADFTSMWEGFSKGLVDVLHLTNAWRAAAYTMWAVCVALAPFVLGSCLWTFAASASLSIGEQLAFGSTIVGLTALVAAWLVTMWRLKVNAGYLLFFPLGFLVLAALAWNSYSTRSKGVATWKGREYSSAQLS